MFDCRGSLHAVALQFQSAAFSSLYASAANALEEVLLVAAPLQGHYSGVGTHGSQRLNFGSILVGRDKAYSRCMNSSLTCHATT